MKTKKLLSLVLAAVMILAAVSLTSCSKDDTYKVGVIQLVTHDALDAATQGFVDALKAELGEENVEIDIQNAANSTDTCATIANSFVTKNVDLIMANATPALQAAYNATQTIPILGTSVTEYGVALGIENFSGTVGSNISGTSDLADLEQQAQMIIDLVDGVQKVGLLYCSAEPNSAYQVKKVKEYLESKSITCYEYAFSDSNDVAQFARQAAGECDAIYVPTDNTAASCAETIYGATGKTPIIAGEAGICKGCGIATLSISYYDLGYKTGEMAAEILRGDANIEEMPIAYADATKKYNLDICEDLGIDTAKLASMGYTALD